jgi:hypothetical protein
MEASQESSQEALKLVIVDGTDIIETSSTEVVISDADDSQRKAFDSNLIKYRDSLSSAMREKSMISMSLYYNILDALRCGKGGKKAGVDVKFFSWCKTHFRISSNADVDLLCSEKNGHLIAVVENYYQVCLSVNQ